MADSPVVRLKGERLNRWAGYVFVTPALILFGGFFLVPAGAALVLGFFEWQPLDPPEFVGLGNYQDLFGDPQFRRSVAVSVLVAVIALCTQLPLAVAIAVLLTGTGRLVAAVRVIAFLPIALSLVAAALVWREIFNPVNGLANSLLDVVGFGPYGWFGDPALALVCLMTVALWVTVPFHVVVQLSGLSRIPHEIVEAGRLDTGSDWRVFTSVKLPLLRESLAISAVLIVTTSFAFMASLVFVLTRGGPGRATEVLAIRAYFEAFQAYELGQATATVSVTVVIMLVLVGTFLTLAAKGRVEY